MNGKRLQEQYKNHLSNFKSWPQRSHAKKWLIFPQNINKYLSIDETSLSDSELYRASDLTILTNKAAKGKKGSIVAIIAGTKAETVIEVLQKIHINLRKKVKEITLDVAANMELIAKRVFPNATRVTDYASQTGFTYKN